ncbi:amidohydrolase [Leucobacter sp. CSA1]|uniref:Amidohydrolase n=1 Tax=Leucobacter chromiisoli TaxID=2796471 RepID=A0A934Q7R4_9MICO|nr:amidohydrolase [Leucobacter chromiisoli]MBK0419820.1 amidohydrolase [Leucobacter chromiisoli]
MRIDLIIERARIWTGDPGRPRAGRVGVWGGRVFGLDEQLDGVSADLVLDAGGAFLAPGFNDVHAHSVWFGQTLLELDLSGAASAEEMLQRIAGHAASLPEGAWVVASNFNPLGIRGSAASRDDLDRATGGRPLWVKHASGHAYTLNGAGLAAVGIADHPSGHIDGGRIVTDASGRATGLIEENAMSIVQRYHLPDSRSDIVKALRAATERYVSEGLTSVTDAGVAGGWIGHSPQEFGAYQLAREQGALRTRMQPMIALDALHDLAGHDDDPVASGLDAGLRTGLGDEWLQLGPVKVFTDGSLLGSTAAMTEDYEQCPGNHGYLLGEPEELREKVLRAASAGWSLALHAIGDRAVDFAIETIAEAQRRSGAPAIPNRIEHGGVVRDDQLPLLAEHRIALAPQPFFITTFGDGMAAKLGSGRIERSYPAASLLRHGAMLPGSSDRPVAPGAPLGVIQAFVERLTESGAPYGPNERISAEQALAAYTRGSAEATGWAGRKGVLAPGMLADMVVLSDDLTAVPSERISQLDVLATVVGGELRHGSLDERG